MTFYRQEVRVVRLVFGSDLADERLAASLFDPQMLGGSL